MDEIYNTKNEEEVNSFSISSCLHHASVVPKPFFIVPTDAHYYKIVETLKHSKL
jgi:hypothetical protein